MSAVAEIWKRIYPSRDEHRWIPVMWLPFMIWFFIDPIWWKNPSPLLIVGNTVFGLVFIWLYLYSFSHRDPRSFYAVIGMYVMAGSLVTTRNGAVGCLLIYAIAAGAFTIVRSRLLALMGITLGLL